MGRERGCEMGDRKRGQAGGRAGGRVGRQAGRQRSLTPRASGPQQQPHLQVRRVHRLEGPRAAAVCAARQVRRQRHRALPCLARRRRRRRRRAITRQQLNGPCADAAHAQAAGGTGRARGSRQRGAAWRQVQL